MNHLNRRINRFHNSSRSRLMAHKFSRPFVSGLLLAIAANAQPIWAEGAKESTAPHPVQLDVLVQEIQTDPSQVNADSVLKLLTMARDQQQALQASVAVDAYLNANSSASLEVILAAARNAVRAGDLRQASRPLYPISLSRFSR